MGVAYPTALLLQGMLTGRELASRAAFLLLSIIHFSNLYFPPPLDRESTFPAMSGQKALEKLKALSPVQQRRAAAILGALLADVASESCFSLSRY